MTTNTKPRLVVVVGPTGSGKTDLAVALAVHYGAPVVSADSRQIYRGLAIGTAQPDSEQLRAAEHHFIASHDIDEDFNCGQYEVQALALLERLFSRHDTVIAAGGSGLYVKALCEGLDDLPAADQQLRERLTRRMADEGVAVLAEELRQLDPEYYATVDRCNPARVQRALEVCIQTGRPYSQQRSGVQRRRPFDIIKIGIDLPREVLYDRIDRRVDAMMEAGLEQEARSVCEYRHLNSLQTVGYKEMFDYFDGRTSLDEAVQLIKRNTRRYAKRQLTWFRRDEQIRWFRPDEREAIFRLIDQA